MNMPFGTDMRQTLLDTDVHGRWSVLFSTTWISALFAIAAILSTTALRAQTLDTPSFSITIDVLCEEGNVTCDDVRYVVTNKKTGKSISLTGSTVHSLCADGVTPCRFQGYTFKRGNTTYRVMDSGDLIITRDGKLLLRERGEWTEQ